MSLADENINDLKVGQRVKSIFTGNKGTIINVDTELVAKCMEHDDYHTFWVEIAWDTHNRNTIQALCDLKWIKLDV